jgi:hypothetical protein
MTRCRSMGLRRAAAKDRRTSLLNAFPARTCILVGGCRAAFAPTRASAFCGRRTARSRRRHYGRAGANFPLRFQRNWVEMPTFEPQGEAGPVAATQGFMRSGAVSILRLALLCLLLLGGQARGQPSPPSEYQVKAAFVLNFAKFVEWPATAFPGPSAPLVIGILGQNPFQDDLARMVANRAIDAHPLQLKEFHSPAEATNCHVLFVSTSESKRLPVVFKALTGASVLTVGEVEGFTETGGMINFFREGTKIRFQINQGAATSAGLKISSKLLSLASRPGG